MGKPPARPSAGKTGSCFLDERAESPAVCVPHPAAARDWWDRLLLCGCSEIGLPRTQKEVFLCLSIPIPFPPPIGGTLPRS